MVDLNELIRLLTEYCKMFNGEKGTGCPFNKKEVCPVLYVADGLEDEYYEKKGMKE